MMTDATLAAAGLIAKALGFGLVTALLSLVAIGGVASLFGADPKPLARRQEDAEALCRLAQRTRSDYVRRGRWVSAEEIRQDIEELEPPIYTRHSAKN